MNININAANPDEKRINKRQVVFLILKILITIALVLAALYGLNTKMADFLSAEQAAQRTQEQENAQLQADYDIANAYYPMTDHYDGQFQEIYEKRVKADYIFIGTSHVTHGVTPEEFEKSGKKFFNFALNGSNPTYYVWWYNSVFKPNNYPKPKAIIVGMDWFMFDTDWLWRTPEYDFKYLRTPGSTPSNVANTDVNSIAGAAAENPSSNLYKFTGKWYDTNAIVTYITNRFSVFTSRSRFIDLVLPEKKEAAAFVPEQKDTGRPTAPIIEPGGFRLDLFYKGYVPYQADYDGKSAGVVKTTFYQKEEDDFISLIDEFQSEGIPLVFIMTPEYLPGRDAPQFDDMLKIINQIATEKNIPFLNYNTDLVSDINYDYTNYSDWGHLDDKGAHLFSQKLYNDLNPILHFTD
ncbi:MAG: hypothetical protein FWD71_10150 [Oscillospiraceae bacterium]|nr:hypothetical protein [Oscillospiraceae bacterium]